LQDIIKEIINMDKEARIKMEAAESIRASSDDDIAASVQDMRASYMQEARHRIQTSIDTERHLADQKFEDDHCRLTEAGKRIDREYAVNKDAWIKEIYERVTKHS